MVWLELNYRWPLRIAVIRFDPVFHLSFEIAFGFLIFLIFKSLDQTYSNIYLQQPKSDNHGSFLQLLSVLTASDFEENKKNMKKQHPTILPQIPVLMLQISISCGTGNKSQTVIKKISVDKGPIDDLPMICLGGTWWAK